MLFPIAQAAPTGLLGSPFLLVGVLFVVMYVTMIRPQAKQAKAHRALVEGLKKGDRVVTSGGLHGTIAKLDEATVVLAGRGRQPAARRALARGRRGRGRQDGRRVGELIRFRPAGTAARGASLPGKQPARTMNDAPVRFDTIEDALDDLRNGRLVVVVDDEDRENEGDLIGAAELVTPESVNFMAREARGLMCVGITAERAAGLTLPMMEAVNTGLHETPFTVSVDLRDGTTTGISAADRAATIRALADEASQPEDFARPGHIFPLRAARGGVLRRAGHTEASVDLARLAGMKPAGVLIEILNPDGTMARTPDLRAFADRHGLRLVTIASLIAHRMRTETLVSKLIEVDLPTAHGEFRLAAYEEVLTGDVHLALKKGTWAESEPVLVRVHSQCVTGDIFGSARCDCGDQLAIAMERVEAEGQGLILYMKQEGRGIGLVQQAARVRAPGAGHGHRRGKRRARLQAGPARLRHGLPRSCAPRACASSA